VLYLGLLAAYLVTAGALFWFILRRTRRWSVMPWLQAIVRTGCIAILFAPTIFACGAAAPIPFPLLVASEILAPTSWCNLHHYQVYWNSTYIVGPMWALMMGGWLLTRFLRAQPPSNHRWRVP